MRIIGRASEVDSVNVSLTLQMTIGELKQLAAACNDRYPAWKLTSAISALSIQMSQAFAEDVEK